MKNTKFVLLYIWWNINLLYKNTQEQEDRQLLLPERLSPFFSSASTPSMRKVDAGEEKKKERKQAGDEPFQAQGKLNLF